METIKWENLKKTYFYDKKTKNLYLIYVALEDTLISFKDKIIKVEKDSYCLINVEGNLVIITDKKEQDRFKKVTRKYGLFRMRDVSNTKLSLKKLAKHLISVIEENDYQNKIFYVKLLFNNGTILTLCYKNKEKRDEDSKNLMYFLSLIFKTNPKLVRE